MVRRFARAAIVGASSGIGAALARELGASGTTTALLARRRGLLEDIAADVTAAGGRALVFPHDVTRPIAEIRTELGRVLEALGGLELLVYAAGARTAGPPGDVDAERHVVAVNLLGAMSWLSAAAEVMVRGRAGTLVGISTLIDARSCASDAAYAASKAALSAYLDGLRQRVAAYGVRVVTARAARIDTAMSEGRGHPRRTLPPVRRRPPRSSRSRVEATPAATSRGVGASPWAACADSRPRCAIASASGAHPETASWTHEVGAST